MSNIPAAGISVRGFDDPDLFRAVFRHPDAGLDLSLTQRGVFAARLTSVELPTIRLLQGYESLPRVSFITRSPQRLTVSFVMQDGQSWRLGGHEIMRGMLVMQAPGSRVLSSTQSALFWSVASVNRADLQQALQRRLGVEAVLPSTDQVLRPRPAMFDRLQALHGRLMAHAQADAAFLHAAEAARAADHQVTDALLECLADIVRPKKPPSPDRSRRREVMVRSYDYLESSIDQPILLADVAEAVGASERMIELAFRHHVGISPKRFLLLRRLNLVRRALQQAAPGTLRVTDVATRFGFWELGRFAGAYRALFGEAPSETLRRPRMEAA